MLKNNSGVLTTVLKISGINKNTQPVCIDCGKYCGWYFWPGLKKPLPITGCVSCGAKRDAQIARKAKGRQSPTDFIGDLSSFTEQERTEYLKNFYRVYDTP